MALTHRQQRTAGILCGIFCAATVLMLTMGREIVTLITGPNIPGYATAAPPGTYARLDWGALRQGQWAYGSAPKIAPEVARLSGRPVRVHGFLLPLHQAGASTQFLLADQPRGCPSCNPPGIAEVVQINLKGGKALAPTDWPVSAYGTLQVATGARDDAVLYCVHDAVLVAER